MLKVNENYVEKKLTINNVEKAALFKSFSTFEINHKCFLEY